MERAEEMTKADPTKHSSETQETLQTFLITVSRFKYAESNVVTFQ